MPGHIFISYSKTDASFALKLADDLKSAGFKVWIDRQIGGGERWRTSILQALREANEMIVVLSPNAMQSEWVMHEGSVGSGLQKPIYPVLLEPVHKLPVWMEEVQYVDFVRKDYDNAFQELVDALTPPNALQDLLDQQVQTYRQTGDLIGDALLRVLEEGEDTLTINEEAGALIERSKRAVAVRRRLIRGGSVALALLVVFAIISSVVAIGANNQANQNLNNLATQEARANTAIANAQLAGTRVAIADRMFQSLYELTDTIVVGRVPYDLAWYGTGFWVANLQDNSVMQVDLRGGAPLLNDIHVVTVGDAPTAVAWTGAHLWVVNNDDDSLMQIDPETYTVIGTVTVNDEPTDLAWDGTSLWVSSRSEDTIEQINPQTLSVERTIMVDDDPDRTSGPQALLWDETNHRLWVVNQGAKTVQWIDPTSGTIVHTYPVGNGPNALAWDGLFLWVSNSLDNTIIQIDPDRDSAVDPGAVGEPIAVGRTPNALLWDGTSLWVANRGDSTIMRFVPSDEDHVYWQEVPLPAAVADNIGDKPRALMWGDGAVWIANSDDASVTRLISN